MLRIILSLMLGFMLTGMLSMSSCNTDEVFALELWVQNDLQEKITISIMNYVDEQKGVLTDTTFLIPANDSLMIYFSNPIGDPRDLYSEGFALFDSIEISKEDGTVSSKEFAAREEWHYEQINKDAAAYTLKIDESDF